MFCILGSCPCLEDARWCCVLLLRQSLVFATLQGRNRVSLAAVDSRTFCVLMQLAKRRSLEEVKALMHAPENMAAALQRVRKQVCQARLLEPPGCLASSAQGETGCSWVQT